MSWLTVDAGFEAEDVKQTVMFEVIVICVALSLFTVLVPFHEAFHYALLNIQGHPPFLVYWGKDSTKQSQFYDDIYGNDNSYGTLGFNYGDQLGFYPQLAHTIFEGWWILFWALLSRSYAYCLVALCRLAASRLPDRP